MTCSAKRGQVREQASTQQHQAALHLRAVADELSEMAAKGGQSGLATQVAQEAAERVRGLPRGSINASLATCLTG